MKKNIFLFAFICSFLFAFSQVPKKIVVEHFTNTKCSACASRNPGFYTNYNSQSGVIHLSVHPSSPYSACVLSQHNASENDARTNYYGIYGGTPRLVIQGVVISSAVNYSSSSIFTPFLSQTSPASIRIEQVKFSNDSIRSKIVIKTEASHTLPGLSLFVALAEDTITYTGSNGEPRHFDVFRKSLTGTSGIAITLPSNIGDSVVYTKSSSVNGAWNFSRIFTLAILQETASKAVVQSESVPANLNNLSVGIQKNEAINNGINVYTSDNKIIVQQDNFKENTTLILYDITGKILLVHQLTSSYESVNVSNLSAGLYLYSLKSTETTLKVDKLIVN